MKNIWSNLLLMVVALSAMVIAGCGTVGKQYGMTPENGFKDTEASSVLKSEIGAGTSTELTADICYDHESKQYVTTPKQLVVRNESFTDSFYKLASGTGSLVQGAGVLTFGIRYKPDTTNVSVNNTNGGNATANSNATATATGGTPIPPGPN